MVRVFANGRGDGGSMPGKVIPNTRKKTKKNKQYLMPPCLAFTITMYGSKVSGAK